MCLKLNGIFYFQTLKFVFLDTVTAYIWHGENVTRKISVELVDIGIDLLNILTVANKGAAKIH